MTGFGLYETLRILIPGATAAAVLAYVLRVAAGSGPALSQGPFEAAIAGLDGTNFLVAALMAGFLLYLLDIPQKTRLGSQGDPGNDVPMPTTALKEMLQQTPGDRWISGRAFSLYFLLSDKHMPPEFHRRVYFFGSIYRMYADARYLTAAGIALGVPLGLMVTQGSRIPWASGAHLALALISVFALLLIGGTGELRHAGASIRKREGEKNGRRYLRRLGRAVRDVLPLSVLIALLQTFGLILSGQKGGKEQALGLSLCALGLLFWMMGEMGPPPKTVHRHELRYRALSWLRLPGTDDLQLTPAQRTGIDIALFGPSLVGAAALAMQQDRAAAGVFLWSALALIATTIMSVRKHEVRLINSLKDQVAWLVVNSNNVDDLRRNAARRGAWT
jgi:hypothetical protein